MEKTFVREDSSDESWEPQRVIEDTYTTEVCLTVLMGTGWYASEQRYRHENQQQKVLSKLIAIIKD